MHGDGKAEGGMLAVDRLLDIAQPPTAIFCYNDMTALGALKAVRTRGLGVPEDISLVGFDDLPLALYMDPPLTTVRQPKHEMGRLATRVLLKLLSGSDTEQNIKVSGELILRQSTATPEGELAMQLLVRPEDGLQADTTGFQFLSFTNHKLKVGAEVAASTGDRELGLVVLGGTCSVASSRGEWKGIGRRPNVFAGMPYALYLPIETAFTVTADTDCDLAFCYCRAEEMHEPRLITPDDIEVEIRGAGERHPADQQDHQAGVPGAPLADRGGLYAERKLVELSAA